MKVGDPVRDIEAAVAHACAEVLDGDDSPEFKRRECRVVSWPQTWGSTACGFGGMGGCMMTTAQTTVIVGPLGDVAVYHAGRLARHIVAPTDAFWDAMMKQQLPGAARRADWAKLEA
jgi:hypothetical protein